MKAKDIPSILLTFVLVACLMWILGTDYDSSAASAGVPYEAATAFVDGGIPIDLDESVVIDTLEDGAMPCAAEVLSADEDALVEPLIGEDGQIKIPMIVVTVYAPRDEFPVEIEADLADEGVQSDVGLLPSLGFDDPRLMFACDAARGFGFAPDAHDVMRADQSVSCGNAPVLNGSIDPSDRFCLHVFGDGISPRSACAPPTEI